MPLIYGPAQTKWLNSNTANEFQSSQLYHALIGLETTYLPVVENPTSSDLFQQMVDLMRMFARGDGRDALALRIFNDASDTSTPIRLVWVLKSSRSTVEEAQNAVENLSVRFTTWFPNRPPHRIPITLLSDEILSQDQNRIQTQLTHISQLRKYWDLDFAHPYCQIPQRNQMESLFASLTYARVPLVVTLMFCPTNLLMQNRAIALTRQYQPVETPDLAMLSAMDDVDEAYKERLIRRRERRMRRGAVEDLRQDLGHEVLENQLRQSHQLISMRTIIGYFGSEHDADVIEASVSALLTADHARQPTIERLSNKHGAFAEVKRHLFAIEHYPTETDLRQHWRETVTPEEAAASITLPFVDTELSVPGLPIRSEPFYLPVEPIIEFNEPTVTLGEILHYGLPSGEQAHFPISQLRQHMLIAGFTGAGKTNTSLHLLRQLAQYDVPFIVVDPLRKGDYRMLLGDSILRDKLRIYTLGGKASPFVFNPFALPPNTTPVQHIGQIVQCFITAYEVSDPVPALYRIALRRLYTELGWQLDATTAEQATHLAPTFRQFYETLISVVAEHSQDYSADVRGNIREMIHNRIGILLEEWSHLLNVADGNAPDPFAELVDAPVIFEIGEMSSARDQTLIMGFLLMCLVPHIQFRPNPSLHILLLEEAHRVMKRSKHGGANEVGEVFNTMMAEIRGFNQGMIVVDQVPSNLVEGVFANTGTQLMHKLQDKDSYDLISDMFRLSQSQNKHARDLPAGQLITTSKESGTPIKVQVPYIMGELQSNLTSSLNDNNRMPDDVLTQWMQRFSINMPKAENITNHRDVIDGHKVGEQKSAKPDSAFLPNNINLMLKVAPFQSCAMCRPLWLTQSCIHKQTVTDYRHKNSSQDAHLRQAVIQRSVPEVRKFFTQLEKEFGNDTQDILYCYIAQLVGNKKLKDNERRVLMKFHSVIEEHKKA